MSFVQRYGSAGLSSSDRGRKPTQTTADYSHRPHAPYHTVWYGTLCLPGLTGFRLALQPSLTTALTGFALIGCVGAST